MKNDVTIQFVENGFIVSQNEEEYKMGKQWAFETARGLAQHIEMLGVAHLNAEEDGDG